MIRLSEWLITERKTCFAEWDVSDGCAGCRIDWVSFAEENVSGGAEVSAYIRFRHLESRPIPPLLAGVGATGTVRNTGQEAHDVKRAKPSLGSGTIQTAPGTR